MIIDGRKIASNIISNLKSEVAALPFTPIFCDVLVGSDPVSAQYVNLKAKKAQSAGLKFLRTEFPENIATADLVAEIKKLNLVPDMCGLIVQLPLPEGINRAAVLNAIYPSFDVDCIGSQSSAEFYAGDSRIVPPTAQAIMHILDAQNFDLKTKNILVLGQGELVGKPVSFLLRRRGLNIEIADKDTPNTQALMRNADVIISGTGRPRLVTGEKIKSGSVIIDAGTAEDGGEIVGDVDFESIKDKAAAVSPVPGGVGPVTVAMLLANVVKVAKQKAN